MYPCKLLCLLILLLYFPAHSCELDIVYAIPHLGFQLLLWSHVIPYFLLYFCSMYSNTMVHSTSPWPQWTSFIDVLQHCNFLHTRSLLDNFLQTDILAEINEEVRQKNPGSVHVGKSRRSPFLRFNSLWRHCSILEDLTSSILPTRQCSKRGSWPWVERNYWIYILLPIDQQETTIFRTFSAHDKSYILCRSWLVQWFIFVCQPG